MDKYLTLLELLMLNLGLGLVVFLIGSVVLIMLLRKKTIKRASKMILLIVLQILFANLLALVIWRFWPFEFDIIFYFISLPALFAEIITIPMIIWLLNCRVLHNRRN